MTIHRLSPIAAVLALALILPAGCANHSPAAAPEPPVAQAAPAPSSVKTDPRIQDLAFISGNWEMHEKGPYTQEWWSAPSGSCMVGAFRIVKPDGSVALYELITISAETEGVFMRLRHFDAALTPWKTEADGPIVLQLETMRNSSAVFRIVSGSTSLDAISYRRVNETTLESAVMFTPESKREPLQFRMTAVR